MAPDNLNFDWVLKDPDVLELLYIRNAASKADAKRVNPTIWQRLVTGSHCNIMQLRNSILLTTFEPLAASIRPFYVDRVNQIPEALAILRTSQLAATNPTVIVHPFATKLAKPYDQYKFGEGIKSINSGYQPAVSNRPILMVTYLAICTETDGLVVFNLLALRGCPIELRNFIESQMSITCWSHNHITALTQSIDLKLPQVTNSLVLESLKQLLRLPNNTVLEKTAFMAAISLRDLNLTHPQKEDFLKPLSAELSSYMVTSVSSLRDLAVMTTILKNKQIKLLPNIPRLNYAEKEAFEGEIARHATLTTKTLAFLHKIGAEEAQSFSKNVLPVIMHCKRFLLLSDMSPRASLLVLALIDRVFHKQKEPWLIEKPSANQEDQFRFHTVASTCAISKRMEHVTRISAQFNNEHQPEQKSDLTDDQLYAQFENTSCFDLNARKATPIQPEGRILDTSEQVMASLMLKSQLDAIRDKDWASPHAEDPRVRFPIPITEIEMVDQCQLQSLVAAAQVEASSGRAMPSAAILLEQSQQTLNHSLTLLQICQKYTSGKLADNLITIQVEKLASLIEAVQQTSQVVSAHWKKQIPQDEEGTEETASTSTSSMEQETKEDDQ